MPDADKNDRLQPRRAEFLGDLFEKVGDIVAESARAERAEIGEVFAKLGGFYARSFGQRLTGNRADAILVQSREAAQINRETINRFPRNDGLAIFSQVRKK